MSNVYLNAALSADLKGPLHPGLKSVPLLRRMTPLQKAVMSVLAKALERHGELLEQLKAVEAPIFFSSAYGEIGAMLRVTQSIAAESLPVSPKDFQHSVLNAAIAYLCMQEKSHQAGFAISGGFESPDLALHLAARRIASGLDTAALIIHAHEDVTAGGEDAAAELLILSNDDNAETIASLGELDQRYDSFIIDLYEGDAAVYTEETFGGGIPWLLKDERPEAHRRVRNATGLELITRWHLKGAKA